MKLPSTYILALLYLLACCGPAQTEVSLRVSPDRAQFFPHVTISLSCEEEGKPIKGWSVKRQTSDSANGNCNNAWGTKTTEGVSCTLETVYRWDSGIYWCESESGEPSLSINITISDGDVILESPVLPVKEGSDVTLRCLSTITGNTTPDLPADFYKDGSLIRIESTGQMIIHNVSKSDEGFYKCHISDLGESPENRMNVKRLQFLDCSRPAGGLDVSLRVNPERSQFFKLESISLSCGEEDNSMVGWSVKRETSDKVTGSCKNEWGTSNGSSCVIQNLYRWDSGLYWCESKSAECSQSINITISDGDVILESPVLPVMEGDDATLRCLSKDKTTGEPSSDLPADFYKDGSLIRSESTGQMTIHNVSKSDEGFYNCHISGLGKSPESWMDVGDSSSTPPPTSECAAQPSLSTVLIIKLLVLIPYLVSTYLYISIVRERARAAANARKRRDVNDVIMEVAV